MVLIWTGGRLESLKLRLGLQGASFEHQSMDSYSLERYYSRRHTSHGRKKLSCVADRGGTRLCNVLYLKKKSILSDSGITMYMILFKANKD
ncbi:hypothetical protein YC2023_084477 [Brassica napus]